MRPVRQGLVTLALLAGLAAQEQPDDPLGLRAAKAAVRFTLGVDGQLTVSPDPASGKGSYAFGAPEQLLHMLVTSPSCAQEPWSQWLFLGGDRLTDATDALRFFERLGRLDRTPEGGMALLRLALRERSDAELDATTHELLRRLAVHALADLGYKPAIGRLSDLAQEGTESAALRQAARRAVASLRGEPSPAPTGPAARPLREVLRDAPAEFDLLLVIDRQRMPAHRGLLGAIRNAQVAELEAVVLASGRPTTPDIYPGICAHTERLGLAAYELARCFGDHRIDRVQLALRFRACLQHARSTWLALDGEFDLAAIRAGVDAAPGPLRFSFGDGITVAVEAQRAIVTNLDADAPRLRELEADALAEALPDAPLCGVLRRLPWQDTAEFGETRFGLELPERGELGAVLTIVASDPAALEARLRAWLGVHATSPQLAALATTARASAIEGALRIEVPRGAVDPAGLLVELGERR